MARTESTVARAELARQDEEAVLSESSLRGARIVSVVRLAVCVLMTLAMARIPIALGHDRPAPDLGRSLAVGVYIVFSVGTFLALRRRTPQPAATAIRAGSIVI